MRRRFHQPDEAETELARTARKATSSSSRTAPEPLPASVGLTDLSFIGMGKMYSYDPWRSTTADSITRSLITTRPNANNFDVTEDVWTGYFKFDLSTNWATSRSGSIDCR
jgi:hypothetical protein